MDEKLPQNLKATLAAYIQASSRRSLTLSAIGAVIGLAIAGYGLFTAKGTEVSGVPAEDVALVNGKPLMVADYIGLLQSLYGVTPEQASKEQKQKVLDSMLREELFVQRGLELDQPSVDPDVRAALVNSVELQTASDALSRQPSEQELRDFYAQNQSKYASEGSLLLHDLVPASGTSFAQLDQLQQALQSKQPLADVSKRFGIKESGKLDGEEFYFAARIHLGDSLFAAASKLANGALAGPISVDGVPHLLLMEKNSVPRAQDFDKIRSQVFSDYQHAVATRLQAGEESFLRKRARIQYAPGYGQ